MVGKATNYNAEALVGIKSGDKTRRHTERKSPESGQIGTHRDETLRSVLAHALQTAPLSPRSAHNEWSSAKDGLTEQLDTVDKNK